MTLAKTTFDYSALEADAKSKLIWYAGQIRNQGTTHVKTGLEIGRLLTEARGLIGADDSFRAWVERECGHSRRSAYNYIAVFEHFGECANFAHIELSAMYELTKNDQAKTKALKLADKGVKVTHAMAKDLVSKAAPKEVPKPDKPSDPAAEPDAAPPDVDDAPTDEPEPVDYGRCPNCASAKWTSDEEGVSCAKCHHPHGEVTGGADEDRVGTQRSKTVKTVEALMRAFDDLNMLCANPKHGEAISGCKSLLKLAKGWK